MHRTTRFVVVALAALACTANIAAAQEDDEIPQLRYVGYETEVRTGGNATVTYFAFVGLAILALGVMFKNSKRTHLD